MTARGQFNKWRHCKYTASDNPNESFECLYEFGKSYSTIRTQAEDQIRTKAGKQNQRDESKP